MRTDGVRQFAPKPAHADETASKDSFVSIEKAKERLGYAPERSDEDALLRNFRWYAENRKRFRNASGFRVGYRGNRAP